MNVSTMKELKGKLNSLNAELFDDVAFREFYKFMFDYAKGEGSSGINAEYGVSGLQVYKGITSEFQVESSDWVTVDPVPGALVVNVGMMLEVWSNMKYKAALHRVVANNVKPRYSAPFFHFPSYSSTIQPILDAPNDLPKYRPIQYGEFRRLLFEGFSKPIPFEQQARLPNFRIN
eukprot:TRINITY_DN6623_c0_g2_i1.p1 TRINITY_DN6623_c0_g2~~TRINITY_DN6623_c0_g2_i1.p1  ORF type:complete len:175 (+),score=51.50 TRINITY_DN6623_c0_g2_i1:2-526(+)